MVHDPARAWSDALPNGLQIRDSRIQFPVPVLLTIHDPESREIFWTDARQQSHSTASDAVVAPSKSQKIADRIQL
jgi:hypothetical protein